jgi:hypothetical protein
MAREGEVFSIVELPPAKNGVTLTKALVREPALTGLSGGKRKLKPGAGKRFPAEIGVEMPESDYYSSQRRAFR